MADRPDTDEDGYWIGRLDDAPIGAKIFLVIDSSDVCFEILRRDEDGYPHAMEVDS